MRQPGDLRRLIGLGLIGASTVFLGLAWYAYFVLKERGRAVDANELILASLLLGVCGLVGVVSRGFCTLALQRLTHGQHLAMAIAAFIFAVVSLWLTVHPEKLVVDSPFVRTILVVGFFAFGYAAIRYVLEAVRRSEKK